MGWDKIRQAKQKEGGLPPFCFACIAMERWQERGGLSSLCIAALQHTSRALAAPLQRRCPAVFPEKCSKPKGIACHLTSCTAIRLSSCLVTWLPSYLVAKLPGCQVDRLSGVAWLTGYPAAMRHACRRLHAKDRAASPALQRWMCPFPFQRICRRLL